MSVHQPRCAGLDHDRCIRPGPANVQTVIPIGASWPEELRRRDVTLATDCHWTRDRSSLARLLIARGPRNGFPCSWGNKQGQKNRQDSSAHLNSPCVLQKFFGGGVFHPRHKNTLNC